MKRWISLLLVLVLCLLLTACGRPSEEESPDSQTARVELRFGGLDRDAIVHLPPGEGGGSPMPVVLVFHGRGGTAEGIERITHFDSVADQNDFIAVYPQGYRRSWADGLGLWPIERAGVDDVGFVGALLDELERRYEVDERRVFATGLSNGAIFAQRLGCDMSDRVSAIAPVAGTQDAGFTSSCQPARPVSVLWMHGTEDSLVPYEGGVLRGIGRRANILPVEDAVANWGATNGCSPSPVTHEGTDNVDDGTHLVTRTYPDCAADAAVELYTVEGGGHTWPGGEQYLPTSIVGKTSSQFDASDIIWEFFVAHPRP